MVANRVVSPSGVPFAVHHKKFASLSMCRAWIHPIRLNKCYFEGGCLAPTQAKHPKPLTI